jgi:hypothetical protein
MMQASAAQPPGAQTAGSTPMVNVVTQRELDGALATPLSAQYVAGLLARKATLSNQLSSSVQRRRELSRQLRSAQGADRAGLEQRLSVLDSRIARLEADIDETGKVLSTPSVARLAQQQEVLFGWGPNTPNRLSDNAAPLLAVFAIFVLFPVALSIARRVWKRGSLAPQAPIDRDSAQRLERMEQAMDAIAIEIERVSEGQRFVTRLLAEGRDATSLPAGQPAMEPLRASAGEKARL